MDKKNLIRFMREMMKAIKLNDSREGSLEYRLVDENEYHVMGSYRLDNKSNDYKCVGFNSKKEDK
jgi:hypothetical protein